MVAQTSQKRTVSRHSNYDVMSYEQIKRREKDAVLTTLLECFKNFSTRTMGVSKKFLEHKGKLNCSNVNFFNYWN